MANLGPRGRDSSALDDEQPPVQRTRLTRRDRVGIAAHVGMGVLCAIASSIVQGRIPRLRAPAYAPERMTWDEHVRDLNRRRIFKRYYRMTEGSFNKLCDLLLPTLERNEAYAREWCGLSLVCRVIR